MGMLHYITAFCILVTIVAGTRTNTKLVDAVCFRNEPRKALEMYLSATFTPGEVDRVLAVDGTKFIRQANGTTNEAPCTIDGTVSSGQIRIKADVIIGGSSSSDNQCGAMLHQTSGQYMWTFQFREKYADGAITDLDRSYTIICNYNSATPNSVVTNVFVIALDTLSNANRIRPENELAVLERTSPGNNNMQVTNTVLVGQTVKLRIQSKVKVPGRRIVDYDHYGAYVFSCDYRTSAGDQGTAFIGSNGCPTASNIFGLTQGFQYSGLQTTSGYRWFQTETNEFVMAPTLPANNFYYLRCYVGYCYTVDNADPKCTDFCASNTNRKKRSLRTDVDQIVLAIRIQQADPAGEMDDSNQDDQSNSSSMRSATIIVASIFGVVMVVAFVFVLIMGCIKYRRRQDQDYQAWDTSSSSQSLPSHLTQDHIKASKA